MQKYGLKIGKDKDGIDKFYKAEEAKPEAVVKVIEITEAEVEPIETKVESK